MYYIQTNIAIKLYKNLFSNYQVFRKFDSLFLYKIAKLQDLFSWHSCKVIIEISSDLIGFKLKIIKVSLSLIIRNDQIVLM